MRVHVTGGAGFIGRALIKALQAGPNFKVCMSLRHAGDSVDGFEQDWFIRALAPDTDWSRPLAGVDVVVHTAARVHVMNDRAGDPLAEFRRVNVEGTLALARQAASAGVRRFVFISSAKVNGEVTLPGRPFKADDMPAPRDAYGISKLEAEQGLCQIARATGMELVVIRPPLVYGPGVRANFQALMRAVARGLPLPLAAVDNRRSLVGLDNLVDFIVTCIQHPAAANETFMVSDGEDLSTPELVRRLSWAMGKTPRLFALPMGVLQVLAALAGRRAVLERVCGNLQVDIAKARTMLAWSPPLSVDEGLMQTVQHEKS